MKQSSRFCFVIGHAQQGLSPSGFSGSMVRQFLSEQLLFAAGEVSTCGDGAGFDGPLNHPKSMVTNSIKRQQPNE
jgi:hypothetical protein